MVGQAHTPHSLSMHDGRKQHASYVRPCLEYCACVCLLRDVDPLESVQKLALKVCCKQWSSPYQDIAIIIIIL